MWKLVPSPREDKWNKNKEEGRSGLEGQNLDVVAALNLAKVEEEEAATALQTWKSKF